MVIESIANAAKKLIQGWDSGLVVILLNNLNVDILNATVSIQGLHFQVPEQPNFSFSFKRGNTEVSALELSALKVKG